MIFVTAAMSGQICLQKKAVSLLLPKQQKTIPWLFSLSRATTSPPTILPVLSSGFYITQLGFFCKQEIKFEKITKIPFKFRLGSVEDCDRMEGKRKRN